MLSINNIGQNKSNFPNILKKTGIFLWLFAIFLFLRGYLYAGSGYSGLIPSMWHISNPSFLQGDWYIQAFTIYHYPFKLFFIFLTNLTKLSIPILFFSFYCLTIFLYILSARRLSATLFKRKEVFFIFFTIILIWRTNGIEVNQLIHENYFQPLFFVTPLCILAIDYLFNNKTLKSLILAGIITNFQFQIGVNLFLIFAIFIVVSNYKRKKLKKILLPILSYALIASPVLISVLPYQIKNIGATFGNDAHFFIDYVKFRAPHHYFLSAWKGFLLKFAKIFLLGTISFIKKRKTEMDQNSLLFAGIIIGLIPLQFFFIEILPIDLFAKFSFYRMTIFVTLFIYLYFSDFLSQYLKKDNFLLTFLVVCIILIGDPIIGLGVIGLLFLLDKKTTRESDKNTSLILYLSILLIIILFNVGNKTFGNISINLQFMLGIMTILVFCILNHYNGIVKIRSFYIPIVILSLGMIGSVFKNGFNIEINLKYDNDWKKMGYWIQNNTPSDALFVTPPYMHSFHLYARRKELANFKENPFLEKDILKWKKRLEDVTKIENIFAIEPKGFLSYPVLAKKYRQLNELDFWRLKNKYDIDYIVVNQEKKLNFDKQYQNNSFSVYKINIP